MAHTYTLKKDNECEQTTSIRLNTADTEKPHIAFSWKAKTTGCRMNARTRIFTYRGQTPGITSKTCGEIKRYRLHSTLGWHKALKRTGLLVRPQSRKEPLTYPWYRGWGRVTADDYIDAQINLHELIVRNVASTFFLRASGDSMLGVGIHDGDLLVVDRSLEASHNRIIIAAIDGELLVKKLCRKGSRVLVQSSNPGYSGFDITEQEYVHIWGVVSHVIHKP